jgi:hypothetical protein
MFSVPEIINIAKASLYLSAIDVQKGYLYSPRTIPESTKMIYMELKAVEWMYNLDPNNSSLTQTANYLYSICRGYNLQAQSIINGTSGNLFIKREDNLLSNYEIELAGIPSVGDQVKINLQDSIANQNLFTYTVVSGDTATSVMNGIVALINASVNYNAFYVSGANPYISIQSNFGLTTVTGSTSIIYSV